MKVAPALRELRRVIAIGATVEADGARLTVLSLEDYADGFVVRGRLRLPEGTLPNDGALVPSLTWRVADDGGQDHHGRHRSAEVAGREQDFSYVFEPSLRASSRRLTIELTNIGFHAVPFGEGTYRLPPPVFELAGSWRIVVDTTTPTAHAGEPDGKEPR